MTFAPVSISAAFLTLRLSLSEKQDIKTDDLSMIAMPSRLVLGLMDAMMIKFVVDGNIFFPRGPDVVLALVRWSLGSFVSQRGTVKDVYTCRAYIAR